jgi:hypothetical protein
MGSKSATPPPVDYTAAAEKTAAGNLQAAKQTQAANMVNQNTPTGSVTYTPTYYNSQGQQIQAGAINPKTKKPYDINSKDVVIRYDQNVNLTPEQQALFDQGQRINQGLGNLAENQGMAQITSAMNTPLKSDIAIVSNVDSTADQMTRGVDLPTLQSSIAGAGDIQRSVANAGNIQNSIADAGQIQNGFYNTSSEIQRRSGADERASGDVLDNLGQIKTQTQDPNLLLQDTTNALYKANTQYLDPQFSQSQSQLENKLANQGITRGSEAYDNAMLNFNNQKQQAYESARNQSIAGGMNAAQGMFGMNLQGNQFANSALGQQFNQSLQSRQLANSAAGQNNQLDLANQAAYNQALGQIYNQNLGEASFANQSQNQQFNQNAQQAAFANAAQNQQFGQNAQNAALANAAQNQQFGQNAQQAGFQNQAALQGFGAAQQNAALNNSVLQQLFGQNLSNANLQNAASNQQLSQAQISQQAPINIINALRSGQQMQVANIPTVGVSSPGQMANVAGADYLGAAQAQGQYNQNMANAQAASGSSAMSGIGGIVGMLGSAMI